MRQKYTKLYKILLTRSKGHFLKWKYQTYFIYFQELRHFFRIQNISIYIYGIKNLNFSSRMGHYLKNLIFRVFLINIQIYRTSESKYLAS